MKGAKKYRLGKEGAGRTKNSPISGSNNIPQRRQRHVENQVVKVKNVILTINAHSVVNQLLCVCVLLALFAPLLKWVVSQNGQVAMGPPPEKLRGWKKEMAETFPCEKDFAPSPSGPDTASSTNPFCHKSDPIKVTGCAGHQQQEDFSKILTSS